MQSSSELLLFVAQRYQYWRSLRSNHPSRASNHRRSIEFGKTLMNMDLAAARLRDAFFFSGTRIAGPSICSLWSVRWRLAFSHDKCSYSCSLDLFPFRTDLWRTYSKKYTEREKSEEWMILALTPPVEVTWIYVSVWQPLAWPLVYQTADDANGVEHCSMVIAVTDVFVLLGIKDKKVFWTSGSFSLDDKYAPWVVFPYSSTYLLCGRFYRRKVQLERSTYIESSLT